MSDLWGKPDKLTLALRKPDLSSLPGDVAARVEDMWRVGGMLDRFAEREVATRHTRALLQELLGLGFRLAWVPSPSEADVKRFAAGHESVRNRSSSFNTPKPCGVVAVNAWVGVTDEQCNRLGCEGELFYFHMALECLPEAVRQAVEQDPLIHCLRRLRNVTVHKKALSLSQSDFTAVAADPDRPDGPVGKFIFTESWFLVVDPMKLLETKGPKDHALFDWFRDICDKHPAWCVFQAGVEHLCEFFANRS